jgi:hypothetical protein
MDEAESEKMEMYSDSDPHYLGTRTLVSGDTIVAH